jgi:predicted acylesterase/phospholipase RssA
VSDTHEIVSEDGQEETFVDIQFTEETLYVDGGLRDNLPMAHESLDPNNTIGIRLKWHNAFDLKSIDRFCSRLAYCCLSSAEEASWDKLSDAQKSNCITVDVGDICTIDFGLNPEQTEELIQIGHRTTRQFLQEKRVLKTCNSSTQTDECEEKTDP